MHRSASNEIVLVSEMPVIIDKESVTVAPGQGKTPISLLNNGLCEELAFPNLLGGGKFGYNVPWDVPVSPARYFNQKFLNFNQTFASNSDYTFFARPVYEQHHLRPSINFAIQK